MAVQDSTDKEIAALRFMGACWVCSLFRCVCGLDDNGGDNGRDKIDVKTFRNVFFSLLCVTCIQIDRLWNLYAWNWLSQGSMSSQRHNYLVVRDCATGTHCLNLSDNHIFICQKRKVLHGNETVLLSSSTVWLDDSNAKFDTINLFM